MNLYDYKLMEKLIIIAKKENELDVIKERLEERPWWDDGFKALYALVLKDVEKKENAEIDQTLEFKDSHIVDAQANKVKVNRYVRSCLRIVTDYLDKKENVDR